MKAVRISSVIGVRLSITLCALFFITAASTATLAADRMVLVEEFTATWCPPCAYAGPALDLLLDNYPEDVLTLEIHVSDAYDIPWGNVTRSIFYDATTIPRVWFDGETEHRGANSNIHTNYTRYQSSLLDRLNVPTDVAIEMNAVSTGENTYDVTTSVSLEADGVATAMRLYLVSAIDHWPTSPNYSRNTLRQAVETGYNISLNPGESTEFTRSITLDGSEIDNFETVKMIAWAQEPFSSGPAEIYNASQLYLYEPTPGDFTGDNVVDGNDFVAWQIGFGDFPNGGATLEDGDANGDGYVDGNDFLLWQANFLGGAGSAQNAVPEPSALGLGCFILGALGIAAVRQPNRAV